MSGTKPRKTDDDPRQARLKSALKANLARRKAQARARAEPPADKAGEDDDKTGEEAGTGGKG